MSNDTILTDDYVAELLAKEASEASIKYSSMGIDAFKSNKMPANKAKPNTRFLGRIIKETTNHNAALLAKETAEAQARLDDLKEAEEKKRRKLRPTPGDIRRRQLGDITSILQGGKKKRTTEEKAGESPRDDRDGKRDGTHRGDSNLNKESRHRHRARDGAEDGRESRRHRHRSRSSRSRSPDCSSKRRKHRYRSRSPECSSTRRKHRVRSPLSDDDGYTSYAKNKSLSSHRAGHRQSSEMDLDEVKDDSDPLDDFIGPAPPSEASAPVVKPRGRGAAGGKARMDSRWSDSYDPRSDSNGDGDSAEEDAVEMFRDRQKWKQQGAERLRTAGFTEEQIKSWETHKPPGVEKDPQDVKWTKAGDTREWDKGKKVLENGD